MMSIEPVEFTSKDQNKNSKVDQLAYQKSNFNLDQYHEKKSA